MGHNPARPPVSHMRQIDNLVMSIPQPPSETAHMSHHDIHSIDLADTSLLGALLALNNAHAKELSWLPPEKFAHLIGQAFLARRIGNADAFLLAFDQNADYDSENFIWFRSRYEHFVYVDRVAVAPAARGHGHARRLYDDLFEHARRAGQERIVCEVNEKPPNPASDAFHAAMGFMKVGDATLQGEEKIVGYFARELSAPSATSQA
jgi:predicted GNAT superfamily acetyltransferase